MKTYWFVVYSHSGGWGSSFVESRLSTFHIRAFEENANKTVSNAMVTFFRELTEDEFNLQMTPLK